MRHQSLINRFPIISDQISRPALMVVLRELEKTIDQSVDGDVVEFGCYVGTTSLFMRRLLDDAVSGKLLYAYDSFAGLPEKASQDQSGVGEQFKAGELSISKRQFLQEFTKAGLRPPVTHRGWFADLQPEQLPAQISFAFLDGDFYRSITDSLQLVWPRLAAGGVICIDDYQREALPGPERAVYDFFLGQLINVHHEHNIAIITPA